MFSTSGSHLSLPILPLSWIPPTELLLSLVPVSNQTQIQPGGHPVSTCGETCHMKRTMKAPKVRVPTMTDYGRDSVRSVVDLSANAAWKPMVALPSARSNAAVETINVERR